MPPREKKVLDEEKKPLLPVTKDTEEETEEKVDRRGIIVSFVILILSIPALVGA